MHCSTFRLLKSQLIFLDEVIETQLILSELEPILTGREFSGPDRKPGDRSALRQTSRLIKSLRS
ncbi:hypothetical protein CS542_09875 [Pedobacter sp. IW39]|nr:hypothetical protein CS542_09875 [Pedobacter sp. IW39]